jgi:predicted N-acetyltransferase YhbS
MSIKVRQERPGDPAAIFELTRLAFSTAAHSSGTEQFIVDALRRDGHLALSLVAECEGKLVGHVAISAVTTSAGDEGWYGIGPLSVIPAFQRQGVGSLLLQEGLPIMRERGARGCVLVGDPAFYGRLGFARCTELAYPGIPAEYLLYLSFDNAIPKGVVAYSPAFAATS